MSAAHFSGRTVRNLARKGITVTGSTLVPDDVGSYANGETVYTLNDNGTYRIRTFTDVLTLGLK